MKGRSKVYPENLSQGETELKNSGCNYSQQTINQFFKNLFFCPWQTKIPSRSELNLDSNKNTTSNTLQEIILF